MNLAGRLNRLRDSTGAQGCRTPAGQADEVRLPEAAEPAASTGRRDADLAQQLQAQRLDRGLVVRDLVHCMPQRAGASADLSQLPGFQDAVDPDWVYIDTETTGLSGGAGTLAFMVGVARFQGDANLQVRQYLLADFAAEARMLQDLADWIGEAAILVSYNGKCFDLPLLAGRARMHRLASALSSLRHLDLMYAVRRAYREHWPDCRLQTAERRRLGLQRVDDLPGSAAPAAWQAWLRHAEPAALRGVLAHNFQDVVSLAALHGALVADYADADRPGISPAAIGRAWWDVGAHARALTIWEQARDRLDARGALQLAAAYRRHGRWSDAESVWLQLHAQGNPEAALELSKYYEHRRRDYGRAMAFAGRCESAERRVRCTRLRNKIGSNLQLPLVQCPSANAMK